MTKTVAKGFLKHEILKNEKIMKRIAKDREDITRNAETTISMIKSIYHEIIKGHTNLEDYDMEISIEVYKEI